LISQTWQENYYAQDELIPLHIDYHITDNTQVVYKTEVCTSSDGCWEWYNTDSGFGFGVSYDRDDVMIHTVQFVDTDATPIYQETVTRDICTNPDGCWMDQTIYVIVDELGNPLYEFETSGHIEYGYRLPFKAIVPLADCTLYYQKEGTNQDALCNETFCQRGVHIELDPGDGGNLINLGWGNIQVPQGEKMMNHIILSPASYVSSETERICMDENGCIVHSKNFVIVDENGFEHQRINEDDNWWQTLPVFFAYGDRMPNNQEFEATFRLSNQEYRKYRLSIHEFIYKMQEVVVLDENLFLIERDSWQQGEDNFIMTFNEETNRYQVKFTNISAVLEITEFGDGYIAINDDETAIIQFVYNPDLSTDDYYYFDVTNLTEGLLINGVNDLIVDYDGSIYFQGVDNFIQNITGYIDEFGVVHIDTEYVEHEVVRVRPIN
jgi:hypothetical protein